MLNVFEFQWIFIDLVGLLKQHTYSLGLQLPRLDLVFVLLHQVSLRHFFFRKHCAYPSFPRYLAFIFVTLQINIRHLLFV